VEGTVLLSRRAAETRRPLDLALEAFGAGPLIFNGHEWLHVQVGMRTLSLLNAVSVLSLK
jgi:hypothetical protein